MPAPQSVPSAAGPACRAAGGARQGMSPRSRLRKRKRCSSSTAWCAPAAAASPGPPGAAPCPARSSDVALSTSGGLFRCGGTTKFLSKPVPVDRRRAAYGARPVPVRGLFSAGPPAPHPRLERVQALFAVRLVAQDAPLLDRLRVLPPVRLLRAGASHRCPTPITSDSRAKSESERQERSARASTADVTMSRHPGIFSCKLCAVPHQLHRTRLQGGAPRSWRASRPARPLPGPPLGRPA